MQDAQKRELPWDCWCNDLPPYAMNGLPTSSRYVAKLKNVSALRKNPPDTFCRQLKRKVRPSACPSAFSANDWSRLPPCAPKPTDTRHCLEQRGLTGTVLANEECDWCRQLQIQTRKQPRHRERMNARLYSIFTQCDVSQERASGQGRPGIKAFACHHKCMEMLFALDLPYS